MTQLTTDDKAPYTPVIPMMGAPLGAGLQFVIQEGTANGAMLARLNQPQTEGSSINRTPSTDDVNNATLGNLANLTGLVVINAPYVFDATLYRRVSGGVIDVDAEPETLVGQDARAFKYVFRGDTNVWDRERSPVQYATAAATAAGSTAVFTAAVLKRWRLHGYQIELTGDAVQAVAGVITVALLDVAAAIGLTHSFFVPGAAGAILAHQSTPWIWLGQGPTAAAVNTALNINLSVALTGGTFRINVAVSEDD